MHQIKIILFFIITIGLHSCMDVFERTYWKDGKYYVTDNPGEPRCKTLYLKVDGGGIGRIDYITRIGRNEDFIVAANFDRKNGTKERFWIINKEDDEQYFNANDIVEGPFNLISFKKRLNELKIDNIEFDKKFK